MAGFTEHEGIAAPLRIENIDTDVIIPIQPLLVTPKAELGKVVFSPLRFLEDGTDNPDFVLNTPDYRSASILVAARNFGCGSSREGAVHALAAYGFRVVISPSFGDIFYGNCVKNGVLPIVLEADNWSALCDKIAALSGTSTVRVNLPEQSIYVGDDIIRFEIDPAYKEVLVSGEDEISRTLRYEADLDAFQAKDKMDRPWVWLEQEITQPS